MLIVGTAKKNCFRLLSLDKLQLKTQQILITGTCTHAAGRYSHVTGINSGYLRTLWGVVPCGQIQSPLCHIWLYEVQ